MAEVSVSIPSSSPQDPATVPLVKSNSITLSWEHLTYSITVGKGKNAIERTLLSNITGKVEPGQIVAIMGASGAGKSTLLNVLAGRIGPGKIVGKVTVNGEPRNPHTWKNQVAYVEQDDLMYQNLTVKETLEYAAYLRLPRTMSRLEKDRRVNQIISELGLSKCKDTKIGGAGDRGISGGERKRVSIGIELVTNPKLLFLDEPTSGLDSFTAANIVESIKSIAIKEKCTVLMTIHQPREYILSLFDKIILLSEGKMVFTGDLQNAVSHFKKCGFECPPNTNPSDFFLDTMTIDFRSDELKQESLKRIKILQDSWRSSQVFLVDTKHETKEETDTISKSVAVRTDTKQWNNHPLTELGILLGRNFKDLLRDPATIGATLGQSLINMLILGFVFWRMDTSIAGIQNRIGALFFICINMTFGNVMPTIAAFTLQREIIKRERASGTYRAISAYLAKILSQIPVVVCSVLIFTLPVYWMIGLYDDVNRYFTFVLIVLIHALTSTIMGIMISSGVPSVQVGQIIGPLIIVVFLIFGGQLVNLDSTPAVLAWIKWISIIHYSYAALGQNEFTGMSFGCPGPACRSGEQVLKEFSLNTLTIWYNILINTCICIFFIILGFLLFRWKSKPLMRLK